MAGVARPGAAKRRRERRLRSWWRHDAERPGSGGSACITAVMWGPKNEALRGQKKATEAEKAGLESPSGLGAPMPLPPGTRPEPLVEPLRCLVAGLEALCPVDGVPSLSTPVLADRAADGVDSSSLRFLTASALEARREESHA